VAAKKVVRKKSTAAKVEESEQLKSYVPDPRLGRRYISRKIRGMDDMSLMEYARDNAINVLLQGDTGAGKTALGQAFAALNGYNYYALPCDVSIDPSALFGKIFPTEEGTFEWVDGPVTELVRYGGVLNISEVNFMPPRIAAALYSLLDSRRELPLLANKGEIIRPHQPDCWCDLDPDECEERYLLVIADMNPKYRGTIELNAAFKNRFPIKVDWGYERQVEEKLVRSKTLLDIAEKLRAQVGVDLRTPVGTNALMEFERIAEGISIEFAVGNFLAGFESSEQGAVKNILDLNMSELKREHAQNLIKSKKGKMAAAMGSAEEEDEEIEDEGLEFFEDDEAEDEDY
jgi:nitric oxide reductase NorQ protein